MTAPPPLTLVDLDQRPDLLSDVVDLYVACQGGRDHVVCGWPQRMGLPPGPDDLRRCLGVVVVLLRARVAGALAICPYSDEQVTLWGPVTARAADQKTVGALLIGEAHRALRETRYVSVRALADVRNRRMREFLHTHGLAAWKDDHVYERSLMQGLPEGDGRVRPAQRRDHRVVAEILSAAFPDSQHAQPSLAQREKDGYRHYLIEVDGEILGATALQGSGRRSWLKLIAVAPRAVGSGLGKALLAGVLVQETARGFRAMGLEVLADNIGAIGLFETLGFSRSWTATVMTGPA